MPATPQTVASPHPIRADSELDVDAFHAAALAAGGTDNGAPGPRPHYHQNYYGAFVLDPDDLIAHADELGLDVERFTDDLRTHAGAARIAEDVDSADLSGVSGTPTFFVNGHRHYGAYDVETLTAAVKAARARAAVAA